MVEIRQAEIARDRERIGFVDAKAEPEGEGEPSGEKSREDSRREPVSGVTRRRFVLRRSDMPKASLRVGVGGSSLNVLTSAAVASPAVISIPKPILATSPRMVAPTLAGC